MTIAENKPSSVSQPCRWHHKLSLRLHPNANTNTQWHCWRLVGTATCDLGDCKICVTFNTDWKEDSVFISIFNNWFPNNKKQWNKTTHAMYKVDLVIDEPRLQFQRRLNASIRNVSTQFSGSQSWCYNWDAVWGQTISENNESVRLSRLMYNTFKRMTSHVPRSGGLSRYIIFSEHAAFTQGLV